MLNLMRFIMLWVIIAVFGGCAAAPPNFVSLKSYLGKDFILNEEKGSYKNIVLLLPSNLKDIREISDYRGVYGAFEKKMTMWSSTFNKLKYLADWDNNASNYYNKENVLVRIKLNDYALNAAKDSTKCISIVTSISIFPFNDDSQFIYVGSNCSGITDIRYLSQAYMSYLPNAWNTEYYSTIIVEFRSGHSVNYSDVVDKLMGFSR